MAQVPVYLIPELPRDIHPFSETQLTVQVSWVGLERLDMASLIPDRISLTDMIENFQGLRTMFYRLESEGQPLVVRSETIGEYDSCEQIYTVGYWKTESETEMRQRLERIKSSKIESRRRRQQKWADDAATRAKVRASQEQTAEAETALVYALAAKLGLKVEGAPDNG